MALSKIRSDSMTDAAIQSNRNILINGAMKVHQRGNQTTTNGGSVYFVDRFNVFHNCASAVANLQQSTVVPSGQGFGNSILIDVTTADTSIAAGELVNDKLMNFKNIFRSDPPIDTDIHWGSRLAIKDNLLFASVGERAQGMAAQDPTNHFGKIIRINLDGSIPLDNPGLSTNKDWLPEIYQIGIRNPQGLSLSPFDGKIYMSNHGAKGGDWFGEVKKGENYGWKILGWGGKNYTGTKIGPKWKPGFTKAIQYWVPSIATSAITIYKGDEFKEWNSHALVTSLKDKSLRKLIFDDKSNVKEEIIFKDKIGRIRDIQVHPINGKIYFLAGDNLWLMEKN